MVVFSAGGARSVSVCVLPFLLPLLRLPLPSTPAVSCPPVASIGGGGVGTDTGLVSVP